MFCKVVVIKTLVKFTPQKTHLLESLFNKIAGLGA